MNACSTTKECPMGPVCRRLWIGAGCVWMHTSPLPANLSGLYVGGRVCMDTYLSPFGAGRIARAPSSIHCLPCAADVYVFSEGRTSGPYLEMQSSSRFRGRQVCPHSHPPTLAALGPCCRTLLCTRACMLWCISLTHHSCILCSFERLAAAVPFPSWAKAATAR